MTTRLSAHTSRPRKPKPGVWKTLSSREIYSDLPWIKLTVEEVALPSGHRINNFYQLNAPDYVVIVALTEDGHVILERQYKHGLRKVALMLPGGTIDKGETPLRAAQRELREETGYTAKKWDFMGAYVHDANRYLGKGHYFFASEARPGADAAVDPYEVVDVVTMKPSKVTQAILNGEMPTLGGICGFSLACIQNKLSQAPLQALGRTPR